MKNKVCIIVCYFGKLPEYFKLWYKSASLNSEFDFLILTDQSNVKEASNIRVEKISIQEFSKYCSDKLKLNIDLSKPYKVCDLRPAYGIIFEKYLQDYDFWGHCDLDQIWGRLNKFINDEILDNFDKINCCGHLTLYRNNLFINNLYKCKGSAYSYKEVFCSKYNYAFDELSGIEKIAKKQKIKKININCFLDIDRRFKEYLACNQENFNKQIFVYTNGKLIQFYIDKEKNNIQNKEFAYIHFQQKNPIVNSDLDNIKEKDNIIINSKGINVIDNKIEKNIINKYSEDLTKIKYEKIEFRKEQIKKFFKMPVERKLIRIKQAFYKK